MEWYGLLVNGELVEVGRFSRQPTPYDFHWGMLSSDCRYEVVGVSVAITARFTQLE